LSYKSYGEVTALLDENLEFIWKEGNKASGEGPRFVEVDYACHACSRPDKGKSYGPLTGLWPGIQFNEAFPNSQDGGLSAVIDLKLMEDIPHMVLDGLFAEVQVIGDFLVRLAIGDQT
jgi:hypothetical protein